MPRRDLRQVDAAARGTRCKRGRAGLGSACGQHGERQSGHLFHSDLHQLEWRDAEAKAAAIAARSGLGL